MVKKKYTEFGSWASLPRIIIWLTVGVHEAFSLESGSNFFQSVTGGWSAWSLAIIGIIVGILGFMGEGTITKKEIPGFLMAGIALVVMGGIFQGWTVLLKPFLGSLLSGIATSLSIFVSPAVGILAIKSIWDIGKDR